MFILFYSEIQWSLSLFIENDKHRYFCSSDEFPRKDEQLRNAYKSALTLARENNLRRVGCSLISAGVFSGDRGLDNILSMAWETAVANSEGLDVVLVAFQQRECDALLRAAGASVVDG